MTVGGVPCKDQVLESCGRWSRDQYCGMCVLPRRVRSQCQPAVADQTCDGFSCACVGIPEPACRVFIEADREIDLTFRLELDLSQCTVKTAVGGAAAVATGKASGVTCGCGPRCGNGSDTCIDRDKGGDSSAGALPINITASAGALVSTGGSGLVQVSVTPAVDGVHVVASSYSFTNEIACTPVQNGVTGSQGKGLGTAAAVWNKHLVFDGPCGVERVVIAGIGVASGGPLFPPQPCACCSHQSSPPGPPAGTELHSAQFISIELTSTFADLTTETTVEQGVLGIWDDGTTVKLGFFDSSEFVIVGFNASGSRTLTLPNPASDIVQLEVAEFADSFSHFDGDVDADGDVDCADKVLMDDLSGGPGGTPLNDPDYRARADFNLDGDINSNDQTAFNAVFLATQAERADLDGDGVVGSGDLAILLGAWGPNPGHPADLDCDGVVGAADLAILLSHWS